MSRKREAIFMGIGILTGLALCGPASAAVQQFTAVPTSQTFYVDGQRVQFEAYEIHGNNFVKLRDIGKAVDFGVTYDGATNTVHIAPASPYIEEVTQPAPATPSPSGLEEEAIHGRCYHCGLPMEISDERKIFYKIPKSMGGKDEVPNMAYAHKHCQSIFLERRAKA